MALAWAAAAWIAGTVAHALFGDGAWPLVLALAAVPAATALLRRGRSLVLISLALPVIFAASILRADLHDRPLRSDDAAHLIGGVDMRVRGVVRDDPVVGDTTQRFAVSVQELQRAGTWHPASGGVLVRTGLFPRYEAGDILELEGAIEAPPSDTGFDYAEYLSQRGIHTVLDFPRAGLVGHEDGSAVEEGFRALRQRLSRGLELALPEPQASLAKGVLLGRRSSLPGYLNDNLNATNTSHLVVVSGANVVLVSAFTVLVLAWAVGARRAAVISIAAIVGYVLLVGLSPPVVRGGIMGILLVCARLSGRRTNGFVSILLAAAIMVGVDPRAIRDVSFQLTFAATAGIVFLAPPLHQSILDATARITRRETLPPAVSSLVALPLATTLAAIIATEPLVALNFERLSLVAVPANMLVVPVFPLILLTSLLAAIGGALPVAHIAVGAPAYLLLTYWIELVRWLADLPAASVSIDGYTAWWAATTYALVTAAACLGLARLPRPEIGRIGPPSSFRRTWPFAVGAIPAVVLVATAGFVLRPDDPGRLRVTVLDVGQGDAILIRTPDGADILVDGGPGPAVLRALGEELPWYDRSLDLVVLTHPQADHLYGLIDILQRYDVQRLVAGGPADAHVPDEWIAAISANGLVAERMPAGSVIDLGDGVALDVIWAPDEPLQGQLNNSSLVLKLTWRETSFLLTGDIEAVAEQGIIASGVDVSSTVLKVPHHGSRTSSTREFLDAVDPQVSVVSAGENNTHGHPALDVVDRLLEYGRVFVTADDGAVTFETDGSSLWISTDE